MADSVIPTYTTRSTTHQSTDTHLSTGVVGLDAVLHGGLLRNGLYLVQGYPGAGKTTLALQFLRECQRQGGVGLYISLSETTADLNLVARAHDWSLDGIAVCDLSASEASLKADAQYTIFHPSEVELGETTQAILTEVERIKPSHAVFDGLSEMRLLARDALRYRRQLLALKQYFAEQQITVLLLDDRSNPSQEIQPESLVSGNIVLDRHMPAYGVMRRRLHVTKLRGSDFLGGYHDYEILSEGIVVRPRLVASESQATFTVEPMVSGVPGLDAMMMGGLDGGTTTLIMGPSGVGKTSIALQYVAWALKNGHRAAVFTFDEVLRTLLRQADTLCKMRSQEYRDQGLLTVRQVDPAELSPGAFAHTLRQSVEVSGARIIVIDSLNGYLNAMPDERFLSLHLHELFTYFNQRGIITILTATQAGLVGAMQSPVDISYLADTVLLLRYYEFSGEVRQAISVFKKRSGAHERTLRDLKIHSDGIHVGEPLTQFQGIMTGVPQYESGRMTGVAEREAVS